MEQSVKQLMIIFALAMAGFVVGARADQTTGKSIQKESTMTARGTFDVKVTQQPQDDSAGGPFGRLFLDKQFHGELSATSKGQMLAAATAIEGSAAYVAFELVTGTLSGKQGTFILQHKGTMRKGTYEMSVTVVPDSGTGDLVGIAGEMKITIEGRKHSYELKYTLGRK
jgi:Protein of unknown function (DUF3224)